MGKKLDQQTRAELKVINKNLERILARFKGKERKKIVRPASKILIAKAQSNISDSDKPHKRYSTPKLSDKLRAPKGMGKVVATYYPGNLRKSIQELRLRRTFAILVGPRVNKRGSKGDFGKGKRVDGYYAHMVEFKTRINNGANRSFAFMRRAFTAKKSMMYQSIYREARKALQRAKKNMKK